MQEFMNNAVELFQNNVFLSILGLLISGVGVILVPTIKIFRKRKEIKRIIDSLEMDTKTYDVESLRKIINSCRELLNRAEMRSDYSDFNLKRIIGNSLLVICRQTAVGAKEKDESLDKAQQYFFDCIKIAKKGFSPLIRLGKENRYLLAQVYQNLGRVYLNMIIRRSNSVDSVKMFEYFEKALSLYGRKKRKYDFFRTQVNLATAYRRIADYQYKGNSEKRKETLNEAVKIYIEVEKSVTEIKGHEYYDYLVSTVQNDMAVTYSSLGDIENYIENHKKALEKYQKSIEDGRNLSAKKPFDAEDYVEYGKTKNNIGLCYFALSKFEERKNNLEKAIKAFDDSMKFRKENKDSEGYHRTLYNHVKAHLELFTVNFKRNELDGSIADLERAMTYWDGSRAFNEISAISRFIARTHLFYLDMEPNNKANHSNEIKGKTDYIFDTRMNQPGDCADAKNILGVFYARLSETESKEENIEIARKLFKEARDYNKNNPKYHAYNTINVVNTYLKQINTFEKYRESCKTMLDEINCVIEPNESIQSRMILKNCYGIYYNYLARIAADVAEKKEHLGKSMEYFSEALNLIQSDDNGWPLNYSWIQNNYGITCTDMGYISGQVEDYERAYFMFESAWKTMNEDIFPLINTFIQCNVLLTNESCPAEQRKMSINEGAVLDILNRYPQCEHQLKQKSPFFLFMYILD